jgi:iron complex transport system permease protein
MTVLALGRASFVVRRRSVAVSAGILVVLAVVFVFALCLGKPYVVPGDVLRSLLGQTTPYDVVVQRLRLPRVVLAVVVGACFGIAGALIQSVARNPWPARTSSVSPRVPDWPPRSR